MIIPKEKIFDNTVFKLSPNLTWETKETDIGRYTVIENFYEDFDAVYREIDKLPLTTIHMDQHGEDNNNKLFFDGRKCYVSNMSGTNIPYENYHEEFPERYLPYIISKIVKVDMEFIRSVWLDRFIVNCFQFSNDYLKPNKLGFGAHYDTLDENGNEKLALVIFLNKNYNEGEGLNLYNTLEENDHPDPTTIKNLSVNAFVQGKANKAVLFSGSWFHGQHTPTDQFINEMRYTQILFF